MTYNNQGDERDEAARRGDKASHEKSTGSDTDESREAEKKGDKNRQSSDDDM